MLNLTTQETSSIKYADGSEKYLYKIFRYKRRKVSDVTDYHKYIIDWPSRYHLSTERIAIVHAVEELLNKDGNVLELGAGTGAITWYLSEKFKKIDAIEGSEARASLIKERLKDKENVNVYTADITAVDYPEQYYDLVTLVGVLEYIPFYSEEEPEIAVNQFLKKLYSTLKEDGVLLIAIENKLGAKYFSGCKEDHNNVMFSGIIDYPFKSPITYSRYELEELLKNAGFDNVQFYHLLPDYKLPKLFVRESSEFYDVFPSGIWRGNFEDYSGSRAFLFSDPLFIENTLKSRTFFEFSNSFLVLASKSKEKNLKTKWLLRKYWNDYRAKKEFYHFVDVVSDGNIRVLKKSMFSEENFYESDLIKFNLFDQNWIKGKSVYVKALKSLFASDNFNMFTDLNRKLIEELIKQFGTNRKDEEGFLLVNGEAIDFTYWNLKEDNHGNWNFFDRKWTLKKEIPLDFILFRNLFYLWFDFSPFIPQLSQKEFVTSLIQRIFPDFSSTRYEEHVKMENIFQTEVSNEKVK